MEITMSKLSFTESEDSASGQSLEKSIREIRAGYSNKQREIKKRYDMMFHEFNLKVTTESLKKVIMAARECVVIWDDGREDD
jgi:hypothetical protein